VTYYYRVKAYDTSDNWSYWSTDYAVGKPTWEQIVDNSDSTRFSASSSWRASSWSPIKYGADYRYAAPQEASDPARFRLRAPRSGSYTIYFRHPVNEEYSSSAPVGVQTRNDTNWARFNLREDGGKWLSLGTYSLAAGDEPQVVMSRWTTARGWLIADAVRMIER
jgi:hypothetical protein